MHKSFIKILSILLIIGLNWTGISAIGKTFAYFSDTENSNANTYQTGALDFSLRSGQSNFTPLDTALNMNPGDSVARDIYINNLPNSLPLKHSVSYSLIDGDEDFCGQLQLKIWYNHYFGPVSGGYANRDMRLKHNGPLNSLTDLTDIDFIIPHPDDQFDTNPGDGTEQWFYYNIVMPAGIDDSYQGESCHFNFVFKGWQDNVANYGDGGFSDIEEIENTIKAGYWNPPVVLNEFLPNAGNYPEYIELYNKTGSSIDLNGFYIKANGDNIPINTITTSAYSGGSTTIPANGWLVVTTEGDILDDTSGTVTLYNPNDVEVDSYAYDASDYNVNNTPGWTNNLVAYWPFDNDFGDKSGNGNNGINHGATFTTGEINQALSFDGVDDYVNCGNDASLNIRYELTMEAWINPDTVLKPTEHSSIVDKGTGYWFLILNTGELAFLRFNQNDPQTGYGKFSILSTTDTIPTGTWTHVAATYSVSGGNAVKLYINGELSKGGSFTNGPIDSSTSDLTIGDRMGLHYFDGEIDEVKIYNRTLSTTEILEHYNDAGFSGAVPPDKSYARIPDGVDNWVDPIPTPGGPNILESEIINQEEAIEEEPIAEELLGEETPVAEEEPVGEGDLVIEEEPMIEEEPAEEIPAIEEESTEEEVITEENQEQGGIIEEINEIINEVIEEIVDEIIPDETADENEENIVIDETTVIEETTNPKENPVIEQQPATEPQDTIIPADNNYPESNNDNINADNGSSINPDSGSSNSSGESSGDSSPVTGEINSAIA